MKEIKKYMDIVRYGKSYDHCFEPGDIISITEKIDGANASFVKDEGNPDGFTCYSRNRALHQDNQLRGFYQWCKDNIDPEKLLPNVRYFGEWLVKHKVNYKEDAYNNFYLFSLWDDVDEKYIEENLVRREAERLNLKTAELFYLGEFISFEHLQSFIGKSDLTEEPNNGEGVVAKCVYKTDRYGRQLFLKLVSEKFAEIQKQKLPKNPTVNNAIIKSVVTQSRVQKLLHKLVDKGMLSEDYGVEDMGFILRYIGVYEDVMKEEADLLVEYEDKFIKKQISKLTPMIVKDILKEEGRS